MRIEKLDGRRERKILAAMITDPVVLGRIAAKWEDDLFSAPWSNLVAGWCVEYFRQYKEPPKRAIENLHAAWAEKRRDRETSQIVAKFLESVSDEHERGESINAEHVIDLAGKHFNHIRASKVIDAAQGELDSGNADGAWSVLTAGRQVDVGVGAVSKVFDEAELDAVWKEEEPPVVEYPGALGWFFKGQLTADAFVAFQGPEKSGKCISEDMEVLLSDGRLRTIRQIVEEKDHTPIVSLNEHTQKFEPRSVAQFWDNGVKICWEVTTRTGRRIVTTSNHKYLTPQGWKELKDVRVGDSIAVPKRVAFFGDQPMPEAEVKFLAYMLADGCCVRHKRGGCASSFSKTDPELVDDFLSVCDELGIGHKQRGIDYGLSGAKSLMRRLGLYGHSAQTKSIPDRLFQCPKEQIALFLRVFFSCDGHVNKNTDYVGVGLSNRKMTKQLSHLLLRFGIVHRFRRRIRTYKGKPYPTWEIDISSQEYVNLFLREINMLSYKCREPVLNRKSKSFLDKFPWQVARRFLRELKAEYDHTAVPTLQGEGKGKHVRPGHAFRQAFGRWKAATIREQIAKRCPIMRQSFAHADPNSPTFRRYMGSDILWDEVTSIKEVGKRRTYDLGVSDLHNFVANDCIVHNTWWLIDLAWRAMLQRKRVAFFEVGDMSDRQIRKRLLSRCARHPFQSTNPDRSWPCEVKIPASIRKPRKGEQVATVTWKRKTYDAPLSKKVAAEKIAEMMKLKLKSQRPFFRLSVHPTISISVDGIRAALRSWEVQEDWVPEVVVIDYADILAPIDARMDKRDQINHTWAALRAMSQELHCLVATATQADSDSYGRVTQSRSNFSEDHRKLAHVTGIVGINVTEEEKKRGIARLNWIVLREGEYVSGRCVHVAGCLPLANPAVASDF